MSHHPSRDGLTCPTFTQYHVNACRQYYSNKGDDDAPQSIKIRIIHNHISYHNYTGAIKKNTVTQKIHVKNKSANEHIHWNSRVSTRII